MAAVANCVQAEIRAAADLDSFLASLGHSIVASLPNRAIYADAACRNLFIDDGGPD